MGLARSICCHASRGSADDTALVEAMHAIKDEVEANGWRRMQAALRLPAWVVNLTKPDRRPSAEAYTASVPEPHPNARIRRNPRRMCSIGWFRLDGTGVGHAA